MVQYRKGGKKVLHQNRKYEPNKYGAGLLRTGEPPSNKVRLNRINSRFTPPVDGTRYAGYVSALQDYTSHDSDLSYLTVNNREVSPALTHAAIIYNKEYAPYEDLVTYPWERNTGSEGAKFASVPSKPSNFFRDRVKPRNEVVTYTNSNNGAITRMANDTGIEHSDTMLKISNPNRRKVVNYI